jgi:PAS domain S-box-containing protein
MEGRSASLEDVLITADLARRPARPPNYEAENRALSHLAEAMADSPKMILQTLLDTALELCHADSAGISVLEAGGPAGVFRWHAIAGQFACNVGGQLPRDASPCGTVLDRDASLLFARPERHFHYGMAIDPPIIEALLAPFHIQGKVAGAIWVMAHTPSRQFDTEDQRLLTSLSHFASAAYQMKTALLTTEAGLKAKTDEVHQILNTCATGLTICSRDLHYLSANPAYAKLAGMPLDQIIGRPLVDVMGARALEVIRPWIDRVLNGERVEYEQEVPFAAGGPRFLHVVYTPWINEYDHVKGWVASVSDITSPHQRAEEALRSAEARLRVFLENSPTIAWLKDEEGRHVYYSPTFQKRFGVRQGDWLGKTDFDLWPKEVAEQFRKNDRSALAGAAPLEVLEYAPNSDGTISWWLSNKFSFRDASGRRYIGGIALDVTDRKLAEEALRVADRRKNEFLSTLGHELRNPLAALSLGLHLARASKQLEPGLKQRLDMMDRQLTHFVRLVDDLLDVGRISAGKIELHLEPVNLSNVLADSMEEVRTAVESRGHNVTIQIQPGQHWVRGDSARLTQLITNLIENAVKYTEPGGRICVSISQEDGTEVVRVEDNGVGIPANELSHVFDLFSQVRVHQGKSAQGLGIGLAIVRTLVELHGGTVEATSAGLGHGSTFTVRLPAPKEPAAKSAPEDLSQDEFKENQQRRRVLIVDDNEDAAQVLADFLRLDGHQTWVAHDGFKAIEIARTTKLDLVLMDLGMPDLDGIETAKRIHALPGCERLRIAALTGWGQESDRALTREAGFDGHFAKPINPTFLSEFVAKLETPPR